METEKNSGQLRIPAHIVFIALPLLCWGLLAFRWCDLWLTRPWMLGVIVFYYALAAAYLAFSFFVRMRVIEIVGLFLLLAASLFMWIPYHWCWQCFFCQLCSWFFTSKDAKASQHHLLQRPVVS